MTRFIELGKSAALGGEGSGSKTTTQGCCEVAMDQTLPSFSSIFSAKLMILETEIPPLFWFYSEILLVKKQKTSNSVFQRSFSSSSTASKPATARSLPSMFTKTANQLRADNRGKSKSISTGDIRGGPSAADNFANNKGKGLSQVFLSIEQRRVLDCVVEQKKNVFFTGSAGELLYFRMLEHAFGLWS